MSRQAGTEEISLVLAVVLAGFGCAPGAIEVGCGGLGSLQEALDEAESRPERDAPHVVELCRGEHTIGTAEGSASIRLIGDGSETTVLVGDSLTLKPRDSFSIEESGYYLAVEGVRIEASLHTTSYSLDLRDVVLSPSSGTSASANSLEAWQVAGEDVVFGTETDLMPLAASWVLPWTPDPPVGQEPTDDWPRPAMSLSSATLGTGTADISFQIGGSGSSGFSDVSFQDVSVDRGIVTSAAGGGEDCDFRVEGLDLNRALFVVTSEGDGDGNMDLTVRDISGRFSQVRLQPGRFVTSSVSSVGLVRSDLFISGARTGGVHRLSDVRVEDPYEQAIRVSEGSGPLSVTLESVSLVGEHAQILWAGGASQGTPSDLGRSELTLRDSALVGVSETPLLLHSPSFLVTSERTRWENSSHSDVHLDAEDSERSFLVGDVVGEVWQCSGATGLGIDCSFPRLNASSAQSALP